jgi:hypothetical protein
VATRSREADIRRFELGRRLPLLTTVGKLWRALDKAGVEFIDPADRMGSGRTLAGGPLTG